MINLKVSLAATVFFFGFAFQFAHADKTAAPAPAKTPAATIEPIEKDGLLGTWTTQKQASMSFKADGTATDTFKTKKGMKTFALTYSMKGSRVTLKYSSHPNKTCQGPGVYDAGHAGDKLKFDFVSDECKVRAFNITNPEWTKQ